MRELIDKFQCKIDLKESHRGNYLLPMLISRKSIRLFRIVKENSKIMELRQAMDFKYQYPCLWYALPHKEFMQILIELKDEVKLLPVTEVLYKYYDNPALLNTLREHGMDFNKADRTGLNIVWHMYNQEMLSPLEKLLKFGCDLECWSLEGMTILQDACLRKTAEVVETLLRLGSNPRAISRQGASCE